MILDIFPENIHVSPKINLNRFSPKKTIANISINDISPTTKITGRSSFKKLCLLLNFSETRWSKTLENEVATKARGTESKSFVRSKKPAGSDEKNLFINIGGNI
jgi:hypothetical protein